MKLYYNQDFNLVNEEETNAYAGTKNFDTLYVYLVQSKYLEIITDGAVYPTYTAKLPNGRITAEFEITSSTPNVTIDGVTYVGWKIPFANSVMAMEGTVAITIGFFVRPFAHNTDGSIKYDSSNNHVFLAPKLKKTGRTNLNVIEAIVSSEDLFFVGTDDPAETLKSMLDKISEIASTLSSKLNINGSNVASIINTLILKSTEIYEGGTKLSSKYHPKGGGNEDFSVDQLSAINVSSESDISECGQNLSARYHKKNGDSNTYFTASSLHANVIYENGFKLENKYHPKGGSEDEEFSADIIYANNLVCESDISECGQNLSDRYHPKGGNANIDFTTRDLTATQGTVGNLSITQELTASAILVGDNEDPVATEEFVNESVSRSNLVSTIGYASSFIGGLMSTDDKSHLDTLFSLLGNENGDSDSVVNTIREVLSIFNNYPEGADLVNALSLKASMEWVNGQCYSKSYIDTNYSTTAQVTAMLPTALSTSDMTEILGVFN